MLGKALLGSAALAGLLGLVLGTGLLQAQSAPKTPAKDAQCPSKTCADKAKDGQCPSCSCKGAQTPVARQAADSGAASAAVCPDLREKLGPEGAAAVMKAVRLGLVKPAVMDGACTGMAEGKGCASGSPGACAAEAASGLRPVVPAAAKERGAKGAAAADAKTVPSNPAESATCACGKACEPVGFAVIRAGKTHFFCNTGCRDAFLEKSAAGGCSKDPAACGQGCGQVKEPAAGEKAKEAARANR